MNNLFRTMGFLIVLVVSTAFRVEACSCAFGGSAVCQDYWQASAVFVGTVIDSRVVVTKHTDYESHDRLVKFSIDEPLRGVQPGQVEVLTGMGGGDCGYPFQLTGRYLVYAYEFEGKLTTGICSRTTTLKKADADLTYVRSLKDTKSKGVIYGDVNTTTSNETGERVEKLVSDAKIIIDGPARKEISTDKNGAYRIEGLPAGEYTVTIAPPEHLTAQETEQKVKLSNGGCAVVSFYLYNDGRLAGTVVNQSGLPIKNAELFLMDADKRRYQGHWDAAYTDENGKYAFQRIPRGRYVLTIRFDGMTSQNRPFPTMYYPGVPERAQAKVITIGEGKAILNYDLEMPPLPREFEIAGSVVWSNGQPATGARVEYDTDAVVYDGKANKDGQFSFKAYEGVTLGIRALFHSEQGKTIYSDSVTVIVAPNVPTIKLTLPQP